MVHRVCRQEEPKGEGGSPVQDQLEGRTECIAVRGTEEAGVLDRRLHGRALHVPMSCAHA